MQHSYDLEGIVKFALRREVMAWRTYERFSELTKDGPAVNMMLQLVEFELAHVRQFTEVLRPHIEKAGIDAGAIVRAAESEPLDLGGFVDEKAIAHSKLPDLLRRALGFEKAMAAYYTDAAKATAEPSVRAVLERLAGEEEHHIRLVEDFIGGMALDPNDDAQEFGAQ